jgi:hypothetical protein
LPEAKGRVSASSGAEQHWLSRKGRNPVASDWHDE